MSSPLRLLYRLQRRNIFRDHVRIQSSVFQRGCSCTAALHGTEPRRSSNAQAQSSSPIASQITESINAKITKDPGAPSRNHRDLAVAQGLFTTSPYSPGSPLLLPNGSDMFLKLADFLRAQYSQFGFREVITPTIYKRSLWERSGHWENYADDMFEVRGRGLSGEKEGSEIGEEEEFGLKPMNCPGHCLLFASERRSYRDLPIRFADFSALHRNEVSGALSGLTRVRRFHQDDGHIFCMPSQIEEEIKKTIAFVQLVYTNVFNLGSFRFVLSTRPIDQYIGTLEEWNSAEDQLKSALDHVGLKWELNEGDGAFYGPKIDIILKDSAGKEHQTATIQLDFQLPQRFGLTYHTASSTTQGTNDTAMPVMIHRAVLGSLERFMALLIEHYDGVYPFWIAPRPCMVMSVSTAPEQIAYVERVSAILSGQNPDQQLRKIPTKRPPIRVEHDVSARSVGKKMVEARAKGYNMVAIVGPKEVASGTLAVKITRNQHAPERVRETLRVVLSSSTLGKQGDGVGEVIIGTDREGNVEIKNVQPADLRHIFEHLQDAYV